MTGARINAGASRRKQASSGGHGCQYKASRGERDEARFEGYAEELLEKVLMRQRWASKDRDAVADFLRRVVIREGRL